MKGYVISEPDKIYKILREDGQQSIEGDILREEFSRGNISAIRVKQIFSGDMLEIEIYPIYRHKIGGVKMMSSHHRETIKKLNRKNAMKNCSRLMNCNFGEKDSWLTLTYAPEHMPEDLQGAKKQITLYIDRLRRYAKNLGIELKYIYTTERGEDNGRIHHHLVCNIPDRDLLESKWKNGRTQARRLQPDDFGLEGMARYISKEKGEKWEKSFTTSQNLLKPIIRKSDTKLSRRQAGRIAEDDNSAQEIFGRLYGDYIYLDKTAFRSDYVDGYFIYVRMQKRKPLGGRQNEERKSKRGRGGGNSAY